MDSSVVSEPGREDATGLAQRAGMTPIPGYRLLEPLGCGGFGEVWKCEAPGGLFKAIKFVYGHIHCVGPRPKLVTQELDALQLVKNIRHPFLLSLERVEVVGGDLLIVMELADQNLADRLVQCQQQGQPGIPREELLEYLCEAAEVLDIMNLQNDLQHLDIKPHNLFLVSNHVKVGDFGVVQSIGQLTGQDDPSTSAPVPVGITPLYSAPETFQGRPSSFSDQYSLAITYCELLIGKPPFTGKNARQLLFQHLQEIPNLNALPEADRALVHRALAKQPEERFPSCLEFVQALIAGAMPTVPGAQMPARRLSSSRLLRQLHTLSDTQVRAVTPSTPLSDYAPSRSGDVPPAPVVERVQAPPNFQLGNALQREPLFEVWEATNRARQPRLLRAYFGGPRQPGQVADVAARLQALRHSGLPSGETSHTTDGSLLVVTEAHYKNLAARFQECQQRGLSGIPRQELLGYLRAAADTLDHLAQQHQLPHLLLSPRHLLLADGRTLLAEAGIGAWFWQPGGQALAALNPRFGAPELATTAGRQADQYSLALIYLEMLTGTAYTLEKPEALRLAPIRDREVLTRALHRQPAQRWPSCRALIDALLPVSGVASDARRAVTVTPPAPSPGGSSRWGGVSGSGWNFKVAEVIRLLAGAWQLQHHKQLRYLLKPGEILLHRCASRLPAAVAAYKMEAFVQRLRGRMQEANSEEVTFQVALADQPAARAALAVKVQFQANPARTPSALTIINVELRPLGCEANQTDRLLREAGPALLESLRDELQARVERRADERLSWQSSLTVRPVLPGGDVGAPITCRTRDISLRGIGLIAPLQLALAQVLIDLPAHEQSEATQIPAKIVRFEANADGTFEVGAQFLPRP